MASELEVETSELDIFSRLTSRIIDEKLQALYGYVYYIVSLNANRKDHQQTIDPNFPHIYQGRGEWPLEQFRDVSKWMHRP